jgi:signal transduction histidine kinase
MLKAQAEHEACVLSNSISVLLKGRESDLVALARSQEMQEFVNKRSQTSENNSSSAMISTVSFNGSQSNLKSTIETYLKRESSELSSVSILGMRGKTIFQVGSSISTLKADDRVWTTREDKPLPPIVIREGFMSVIRYTVPIFVGETSDVTLGGALVADLRLDSLLAQCDALRREENASSQQESKTHFSIVIDKTGNILFHPNTAFRYQPVNVVMSDSFFEISAAMTKGENGWRFYEGRDARWLVAYRYLKTLDVAVAIGLNHTAAAQGWQRAVLIGFLLTFTLGAVSALFIWRTVGRHTRNLERVKTGAAEVARGNLDQNIGALSSDDIGALALNINALTEQLRAQAQREVESKQLQAFSRLSAMLTHDLKNAATTLSLLVKNMEANYEDEEFRKEVMEDLNRTTEKLKSIFEKLSRPSLTMSGEFNSQKSQDLVPIIKRVIGATAGQTNLHEVETILPDGLVANVDEKRIESVIENLVINALEAMDQTKGKITIEAGALNEKEVFVSVSDTGPGMSEQFQKEKLFRLFSTTKRKGLGLGLYSCNEIVVAHGGRIEVASKLKAGTTFRVVLPSA